MKMKKALAGSLIVTSLAGGIVAPAFPSLLGGEVPVVHAQEQIQFYTDAVSDTGDILVEMGVITMNPGDTYVVTVPPAIEGWEFQYAILGYLTFVNVGDVITYEMVKAEADKSIGYIYYKTQPTTDPVTPPSTDPSTPPDTEVPPTTQPETETPATPPVIETPTTEVPGAEVPASEAGAEAALISYDLAGGSLKGQTGTVSLEAKIGDTITLPEAPVREGYRFLHWKGSVYQPGANYTVTGPKTFTAVWEPVAAPASTSTSNPAPTTSEAEKKILPVTGEAGSLLPFLGLALLSAGAYYKGRKK